MASIRKRGRVWYYAYIDGDGKRAERKGCTDRRVTEQVAASAEAMASKIRSGLVDPRDVAFRDADRRPIKEHLDDWRSNMESKGRAPDHVALFRQRAGRVVELARAKRLSDLSSSSIQSALDALRDQGLSNQTATHARSATRAFCRWARADGRMRADPIAGTSGFNAKEDVRRVRRGLSTDEISRLIEAAANGRATERIDGPTRAWAYRLAAATGFRAAELRALTVASFRLDGDHPSVILPAKSTKNRKAADQPIPRRLADQLRVYLAGKPPGEAVAPIPRGKTGRMIRVDLKAAGIAYSTSDGVADFHSLRGYYVSSLIASGASLKVVQTLARHSTPVTTLNHYVKIELTDISGAVEALPNPTRKPDDRGEQKAVATGADGGRIGKDFAAHLPHGGEGTGRIVTDADAITLSMSISSTTSALDANPLPDGARGTETAQDVQGSWRERMGIEPTRSLSPDPSPVLKTGAGKRQTLDRSSGYVVRVLTLPHPCRTTSVKPPVDPDLDLVAERWANLPSAIKAGILAMIRSSEPTS